MSEKILVAMSGGVDSSVAAALLAREGCAIEGAYMKNWINEPGVAGDCPWQEDIECARAAAAAIGIPFRVVNLMGAYRARVVDYLLDGYRRGLTPNPDVMCNREIKFGVFLQWARDHGFAAVATGHYARREPAGDRWALREGADPNKDQSYFLALLRQEQAAAARFPIGDLPKPEVRRLARVFGLPNAERKDSQGICFVGKVKMADFLRAYLPDAPGEIVDLSGRVLGEHRGLHFYTLGQRRGIRVASAVAGKAYVVVEKRVESNRLVIALEEPRTPGLYASGAWVSGTSWVLDAADRPTTLLVRPRYRAPKVEARWAPHGEGAGALHFAEPQRAIAPGQICAFYEGDRLLGGGVFGSVYSVGT